MHVSSRADDRNKGGCDQQQIAPSGRTFGGSYGPGHVLVADWYDPALLLKTLRVEESSSHSVSCSLSDCSALRAAGLAVFVLASADVTQANSVNVVVVLSGAIKFNLQGVLLAASLLQRYVNGPATHQRLSLACSVAIVRRRPPCLGVCYLPDPFL